MQPIAVLSHVVLDEVHQPGFAAAPAQIGGAGAYAASGVSLATAPGVSLIVSGVGSADWALIAQWATARGINPGGLFLCDEHSPRTRIVYDADGERTETPVYGMAHFIAQTPRPRHIPVVPGTLGGVYLFHAHEEPYWRDVAALRARTTAPVLWEISQDSCQPELLSRVRECAGLVDILSINRTEAEALCGESRASIASTLAALAPVVLLRLGAAGSVVFHGGDQLRVPAVPVTVRDQTGGGNAYSGAFLGAFAASGDVAASAARAAVSAAEVVGVIGTPPIGDDARERVRTAAAQVALTKGWTQ